jgi:outer membrane lipoprotein-sorting protein
MHRRYRVALLGGALSVLIALGAPAGAQSVTNSVPTSVPKSVRKSVPMPVPAPHSKARAVAARTIPATRPIPTLHTGTVTTPAASAAPSAPATAPKSRDILEAKRVALMNATAMAPAAAAAAVVGGKSSGIWRIAGAPTLDASQRTLVDKANNYLTGLNTLVGNFVQVGPDGSRSEGQFYLQKPGRVRFEYNPPNPTLLIADGSQVAVRDRKLATQDLYPLSQTPLRFLVADRIDLMKDTSVIGASADDTFATIVIEERQVLGGTHRLMLLFGARDFQLRQWTITDPQGYDTTVALYNLDSKQKPDPNLFKIDYTRYLQ